MKVNQILEAYITKNGGISFLIKNIEKYDYDTMTADQGFLHDTQLAKILNVELRHLKLDTCKDYSRNKAIVFPSGVSEITAKVFVADMQTMIDCALQAKIDEENSLEYKFIQKFNNEN